MAACFGLGRFGFGRIPTFSGSTLTRALSASWKLNGWSETGFALAIPVSHKMATAAGHQGQFASWHTSYHAEVVASGPSSAFCQDCAEDIGVLSVVLAERKLSEIERQIPLAYVVICAHDAAFQERPKDSIF